MVKRLAVVFLFDSATKHKETDNMMLHREADNIPKPQVMIEAREDKRCIQGYEGWQWLSIRSSAAA